MYEFRDAVDVGTGSVVLGGEAMSVDGVYIEDKVEGYRTLTVSGRESLEYTVTDDDRPVGVDGMEYYGKRQKSRTLSITFELLAPTAYTFMQRYRALKNFCKGENRKLRFADEPNAHYTGTLLAVDEPDAGSLRVVAKMTFYCADPYLVSDLTTTVTASTMDGVLTAKVNNDGSGEVFPTYRIVNHDENGYLGIVHPGGAFEMGNREEADTTGYTRSERLLTGFSAFSAFSGANPQDSGITLNGSLTLGADGNLTLNSKGAGSAWHGGCYRAILPADSNKEVGAKNFYCWWRSRFETGLMGQTGLQQILLADENNCFICGYGMYKADTVGNSAHVIAWIPSGEFKSIDLTPSAYVENPFRNGYGESDLLKEGGKLRFHYYGNYYSVYLPEIANKKVTYLYVVLGDWGTSSKYISVNQCGSFYANKNMVEKERDVPNRYAAGSEIVVNTADDTIKVAGMARNDELITGSVFAPLPPGETSVEFYPSTWCDPKPEVTVEFNKRWL